ncbi:uncharacterized protein [Halyomorpha halys]|uniref:uncharacterized protein isoform X2 n=1 Tax=Halyomorpha halys TaxID=286706 RepID=UPI0006D4F496|nr:uncharacterized protein LOC106680847 isoform X2 [Halyomorpha halys]
MSVSCSQGRAADEARALVAVFILLLALVPAGSKHTRKTHIYINSSKAQDGSRGRNRAEAEPEGMAGRSKPSPKPLRRLRVQAGNTREEFMGNFKKLPVEFCNRLINSSEVLKFSKSGHAWLPKNPTRWYQNQVRCEEKRQKVMKILPELHRGLLRYIAAIEWLQRPPMTNFSDCLESRTKWLKQFAGKMEQLLLEVDKCMEFMGIRMRSSHKFAKFEVHYGFDANNDLEVRERGFPSVHSKISAHMHEALVFFRYSQFIDSWNHIVRRVVGKKGFKRCKQNTNYTVTSS